MNTTNLIAKNCPSNCVCFNLHFEKSLISLLQPQNFLKGDISLVFS